MAQTRRDDANPVDHIAVDRDLGELDRLYTVVQLLAAIALLHHIGDRLDIPNEAATIVDEHRLLDPQQRFTQIF